MPHCPPGLPSHTCQFASACLLGLSWASPFSLWMFLRPVGPELPCAGGCPAALWLGVWGLLSVSSTKPETVSWHLPFPRGPCQHRLCSVVLEEGKQEGDWDPLTPVCAASWPLGDGETVGASPGEGSYACVT